MYIAVSLLFRFRLPDPGGTPLSFHIQDEADLLHVGDAHQFPIELRPEILCLPWRNTPIRTEKYKSMLIIMAKKVAAPYILPIHYDLPGTEADPAEIIPQIDSVILGGEEWHVFNEKKDVQQS
jgi:L-ascorbate metabolism protein UlaG (beta-lactamase superfamily)